MKRNIINIIVLLSGIAVILTAIINVVMKNSECGKFQEQSDDRIVCENELNSKFNIWYTIFGSIFGISILAKLF